MTQVVKFTIEERHWIMRTALARTKPKKGNGEFTPPGETPFEGMYRGVAAELAGRNVYGGRVSEEIFGALGDNHAPDFIDDKTRKMEAKSNTWLDNPCLILGFNEIDGAHFDDFFYVLVAMPKDIFAIEKVIVYPPIHAANFRQLHFLRDWGYGPRRNVWGSTILEEQ